MSKRAPVPFGVGRQIAIVRRGLGDITREKLAELVHIGARTLERIEGGHRELRTAELIRIAEALKVSAESLFPKKIPVSKYASLNFGGDLYTAEVHEENQLKPFVVFHAYDHINTKAFETDASARDTWFHSYDIEAEIPISIRPASENERAIWGGGAAAYIADLDVANRAAFLVENQFFEVGFEEDQSAD